MKVKTSTRNWEVMYNRDEDIFENPEEPVRIQSLYNFIDPIIAKVDAYLIDPGAKVQNYPTKAGEMYGADEERWNKIEAENGGLPEERTFSKRHRLRKTHLQSILKSGNPISLVIDRCHEKGIKAGVSRRMNDCHPQPTKDSHFYSRFFAEHPQYWLYPKYANLDFTVKEVQANTIAIIKEYCDLFDIDILELDFLRHTMYFKPEVPQEKRFRIMNDIVEEIREYSLAIGKKRGRDIALQVRIPPTVNGCENIGLDVKTWVKNGWVDALVPSPAFSVEFDIPVEDWRKLAAESSLKIFPGTDYPIEPEGGPIRYPTIEMMRGAIAKYYRTCADGIHLFNTFCEEKKTGKSIELQVLETAQKPESTIGKSKYYLLTLTSQIEWTKGAEMPMQIPAKIPIGESSTPLKIDFLIADDLKRCPPGKMLFRIQIRGMDKLTDNRISVVINGVEISEAGRWLPGYRPWMGDSKDNPYIDPWLEFGTSPDYWRQDNNQVEIKIMPSQLTSGQDMFLRGMEVEVIY